MPNTLLVVGPPPPPRIISCLVSARSHCCTYFFTFSNDCATFKVQRDCQSANLNEMAEQLATTCLHEITVYLLAFISVTFWSKKTDDCEWRSIFVLVDVPVCIYQSNRPSWGSQSSLSHTTVNSNRCTSWDCASSFIFIPLPVNSLKRVITPPQTTQSPLRLDLSFSFLLRFIVSSLGAIAAHTTWYRHPHPGQHRCAQCNFCVGLKPESCSQTLKPSPPTIKSSCHCIWNLILYCLTWRFILWRPPGFWATIFPRSNLNSSVGSKPK